MLASYASAFAIDHSPVLYLSPLSEFLSIEDLGRLHSVSKKLSRCFLCHDSNICLRMRKLTELSISKYNITGDVLGIRFHPFDNFPAYLSALKCFLSRYDIPKVGVEEQLKAPNIALDFCRALPVVHKEDLVRSLRSRGVLGTLDKIAENFESNPILRYGFLAIFESWMRNPSSSIKDIPSCDLTSKKLVALPESIGMLSELEELCLDDNELTRLPESLGKLSKLRVLSLCENRLDSLPGSIGMLGGLEKLYLKNNQITVLPESLGDLSELESLVLSDNCLASLPRSIVKLSKLTFLDLANNCLTCLPLSSATLKLLEKCGMDKQRSSDAASSIV